jgi:putative transposase
MFHCYRKWKTPKGCTPFQEIMCSESLPPDAFTSDFKIALKDDNRFYLILPRKIDLDVYQSGEQETKREDICAIDPGIRKFATAYSPSGPVRIYGHNVKHVHETYSRRIQSKRAYVIKVQRAASDGRRNRRRIRRAAFRLKKAKNRKTRMVQDFHYKLAHVLCRTYKTIIYPDFSTQGMGGWPDIVKKRAQMLSHGLFKTRLLATSTKFKATRIVHGSEAYTSKQCGACGNLNNGLGTSETWTCSANCGCELADRDVHAARNILLRFIDTFRSTQLED